MSIATRRPFVAGNWKMNKDIASASATATEVAKRLPSAVAEGRLDAGLFPASILLPAVFHALRGTRIVCGAQDMHWETSGPFTGEISGPMIRSAGATAVLLGHSERRKLFGETDERVTRKLRSALSFGLRPILCVGETLEERKASRTEAVVLGQIRAACSDLTQDDCGRFDLAYEPVWAIGTGVNATPAQAAEVHARIRRWLGEKFGAAGTMIRILYGGSVNTNNIGELMASSEIDGALVGGASLEADSFVELVNLAAAAR